MSPRMKLIEFDIIQAFSNPEYSGLLDKFNEKHYNKKELITFPNAENNIIFIVKSGRVRVYLAYEDKEFTLAILEKGDIYSSHTRAFTQVLENTDILTTDTGAFGRLIFEFPKLSSIIIKVLGDLMNNCITIINGLVFKEIYPRLGEFLLQAAQSKGKKVDNGILIELGLTTEEMSAMVGATRQSVSVLLKDMENSGIIKRPDRRKLIVQDLDKLKEIAEWGLVSQ